MTKVFAALASSADGYITGPDPSPDPSPEQALGGGTPFFGALPAAVQLDRISVVAALE